MTNPARDLFWNGPTPEQVRREALRMWREREMGYPQFTRRLIPDELDYQTGAWGLMLKEASDSLSAGPALKPAE